MYCSTTDSISITFRALVFRQRETESKIKKKKWIFILPSVSLKRSANARNVTHVTLILAVVTFLYFDLYLHTAYAAHYVYQYRKYGLIWRPQASQLHTPNTKTEIIFHFKPCIISSTLQLCILYWYHNVTSVCIFIDCWPCGIKGQMASNPRQQTCFSFFIPPNCTHTEKCNLFVKYIRV